jgi:hypothetical protein
MDYSRRKHSSERLKKFVIFVFSMLTLFFVSFQFNVKPAYASEVSITLTSSPATGLGFITLNGTAVTTPYTFSAQVGDLEMIAAVSPANNVAGQSRYVWASWSNGRAQNQTITVGSLGITYTANFQLQYYLTVSGGYSTTGQGWYNSGTLATASSNWLQSIQGNTTGLVGLWHFDEGTGATAYDNSGNGNNGTLEGSPLPAWVAGKYGDALSFNGSLNNYVEISRVPTNQIAATLSAWVYPLVVPQVQGYIAFNGVGGVNGYGFLLGGPYSTNNNHVWFVFPGAAGWVDSGYAIPSANAWYQITMTLGYHSSTQVSCMLYVNGQLVYNSVLVNPIAPSGSFIVGSLFSGIIDEVRVYNRTLSSDEISSLYYSQMAVTNYAIDGVNQNPARQYSGTLTTSSVTMSIYHTVAFTSTIQYLVSFQPMDNSGTETITPSSFQIEINDTGVTSVPELKIWLDNGTTFQIDAVTWENADVKPTSQSLYVVNAPMNEVILDKVFDANLKVTDYLGIPVLGAQVTFNLANETTIQLTTGSDGTLSLGLIPMGTFRASISYLGTTTEVNGDASVEPTITVKIFASYPTFSLIGGGIIIVAVGYVLVRLYRRSPPLQAKIKGYFRVNYGAPSIRVRKSAAQTRFEIYFRVNWGVPFIVGFMLLLIAAAVSLSAGMSSLADAVAVYACYALVVGIVLQLASFLKYRKRDGGNE